MTDRREAINSAARAICPTLMREFDGADAEHEPWEKQSAKDQAKLTEIAALAFDAVLNILAEPGEEVVREIGRDLAKRQWTEAPSHSYVGIYGADAHYEWTARAAIKSFLRAMGVDK